MPRPTASVIVATWNESANIDHVLDAALSDDAVVEVIVADGGSTDGTAELVEARALADDRVRLVHNAYRIQSAGLNLAAATSSGDVLIRLDGHTTYAPDYVTASLAAWEPGTAVGGPMRAEGNDPWSEAAANAMDDPMAVGPARFHHATSVEEVDTVYLGTFSRSRFLDLGGYRTFPSGTVEDTDFYARWRTDGGTVRVDPSLRSWYHPRKGVRALWRQYARYGRGKAEMLWLNRRLPSLRPLAPAALVLAIAVGIVLGLAWSWWPLAAIFAAWLVVLAVIAARAPSRRIRTGIVAGTMHLAYGSGYWFGLIAGPPDVITLGLSESAPADPPTAA
jgi:glycosyltransferase involved in cell wall biosynthesis